MVTALPARDLGGVFRPVRRLGQVRDQAEKSKPHGMVRRSDPGLHADQWCSRVRALVLGGRRRNGSSSPGSTQLAQ